MKYFSILLLLLINVSFASGTICDGNIEEMPILEGGRLKPLYVTANESIKFLVGKKKFNGQTNTQTYCLLSHKIDPAIKFDITTKIEHEKVRDILDIKDPEITYEKLSENATEIRMAYFKNKDNSSLKNALEKILKKIGLYKNITTGQHWRVPVKGDDKIEWMTFARFAQKWTEDPNQISMALEFKQMKEDVIKIEGDKYLFELKFLKWNLPSWALLTTSLALICLVLFKKFTMGLIFTWLTFFIQIALMAARVYISGRAPVTNMYETVMFSGFGSLLVGGAIAWGLKEKLYLYIGLAYNMCTLLMMNFATSLISASISPLVPVLRDNFWLSTHVTMVVMSYGALALSWILANTAIIRKAFFTFTAKEEKHYSNIIYNCLKFGTVMLFFGIMLGGVWADYSWGRFWGWDPKETWSLIVFCLYVAILHGKHTSWIPTKVFIPAVAFAFLSVMMAWFGVNYILAAGLHSYGFSQGGSIFLGSFFLIQIVVLFLTNVQIKRRKLSF